MVLVLIHYWAGARAAAGVAAETVQAPTVAAALDQAVQRRPDPHFSRVVRASTVLVDGTVVRGTDLDQVLDGPVEIEILPPFAGG